MVSWCLVTLAFLRSVDSKGGSSSSSSGSSYSSYSSDGGSYGSGVTAVPVIETRYDFSAVSAYAETAISHTGRRRRWGTFGHGDGFVYTESTGSCTLVTEDEMNDTCSDVIGNETQCFDCMACEGYSCMIDISNCDEYLASVYQECCVAYCDAAAGGTSYHFGFSLWISLCLVVRVK